ncbi:hypothetical protein TNCV_3171701 [Trichonephila clavipes]|nr:hypothetical protein TNCV_3171701 [Trichonephila clavipes]
MGRQTLRQPRTLPPVTIRELRLAAKDEWAAMPQQIDTIWAMKAICGHQISNVPDMTSLVSTPKTECSLSLAIPHSPRAGETVPSPWAGVNGPPHSCHLPLKSHICHSRGR